MRKQVLRSLKRVSLLLFFVIFCFGKLQAGISFKGHQKGAKQLEREEKESRSSYYAIASSQTLSLSNSDMLDLLRYAHKVNPSSLQTKNELSLYYFVLNPELAIQMAKESIKGDKGENYWYYDRLSDFLAIQDKDKETIELYDKMIQLFPKRRNGILEKKILFYTAKKEYLSAVKCCKDLELYKGECEELAFRKCNLYTKAGFLDSAVFEIDKLIKKYPSNATYRVLKGELFMESGNRDDAYSSFMEAKEIDANNSYLNASLADYYKTQGDSSLYTQFINELLLNNKIDLNVKSNIILDYVSYYLNNNGNVENAIEIIKSLIENGEQKSELHLALANILAKYDYEKEAIEQFKIAMQLEPTNREAWVMMMEFQMKKGRYSDLLQSVEDALVYFPNDYVFFLYRGLAYMLVDKDEDAIVAFQEGLKALGSVESSNPIASSMLYEMLGDSYYKLNQKEKSFEAFENALTQNPQNAGAMNNYAYYLSLEGENLEHAEELSGKSIKLDPNNPIYLDTYAWIYFKMKKYDLAKFYIEQAMSYDTTNNVEIIEHYGDILYQSGNEEEALKQWKKAKELGSQSALLDQKIKEKHYIKEKNENK